MFAGPCPARPTLPVQLSMLMRTLKPIQQDFLPEQPPDLRNASQQRIESPDLRNTEAMEIHAYVQRDVSPARL